MFVGLEAGVGGALWGPVGVPVGVGVGVSVALGVRVCVVVGLGASVGEGELVGAGVGVGVEVGVGVATEQAARTSAAAVRANRLKVTSNVCRSVRPPLAGRSAGVTFSVRGISKVWP
jgi:hypothetical protein